MNNDYRTVIAADVAHDLREMLGEEFDLYFVEVPPVPETTAPTIRRSLDKERAQ